MVGEPGDSDKVVYSEKLYTSILAWILVLSLVGLYGATAIGAVARHRGWGYELLGIVALLLLVVLALFSRLVFTITETHVIFGFSLFKKRFKRADIVSCEPHQLRFSDYLGYGIHLGFDRTIAYKTRNGDGVKLVIKGIERAYVVSVNNCGYVCKLLSEKPGRIHET